MRGMCKDDIRARGGGIRAVLAETLDAPVQSLRVDGGGDFTEWSISSWNLRARRPGVCVG
jgi:hypothetical protein